jgi:hypothetical protein
MVGAGHFRVDTVSSTVTLRRTAASHTHTHIGKRNVRQKETHRKEAWDSLLELPTDPMVALLKRWERQC